MLLRVAKEDRDELRQILEALEQEGKIYLSKRGKYCKGHAKRLTGVFRASLKGIWLCSAGRRRFRGCIHRCG